jgi:hypothetical protein
MFESKEIKKILFGNNLILEIFHIFKFIIIIK